MSGDGVAGGAFMAGFTVVNYGNVVFARPDYVENPLVPSTLSTGSLANPFPVLAPEGDPNSSLAANPNHNPTAGLEQPATSSIPASCPAPTRTISAATACTNSRPSTRPSS